MDRIRSSMRSRAPNSPRLRVHHWTPGIANAVSAPPHGWAVRVRSENRRFYRIRQQKDRLPLRQLSAIGLVARSLERASQLLVAGAASYAVPSVAQKGQRACPPEDVGGTHGYDEILRVLSQEPDSDEAHDYRT